MKFVEFSGLEKDVFNAFIQNNASDGGLLQSWHWGEFKHLQVLNVWRVGVQDKSGNLLLVATVLCQRFARFWRILYCPRGPVVLQSLIWDDTRRFKLVMDFFLKEMATLGQKQKAVCLRLEPGWETTVVSKDFLLNWGFLKAKVPLQPMHTLKINLTLPLPEIVLGFKPKARYNLRLAQRKGVLVKVFTAGDELETWMRLFKKTVYRQRLRMPGLEYFKQLFFVMARSGQLYLYVAYYQGEAVAANVVLTCANTAYYLYGATDEAYKNVMAPYVLHWEVIDRMKQLGYHFYDLWGIQGQGDQDQREQRWAGLTRFKKGLAYNLPVVEYVGSWELPYRKRLYKMLFYLR